MKRNEIVFDPVRRRHVVLAPKRARRAAAGTCPFCAAARRGRAVIANAYPTVSRDNPKAYGHHDIVIDAPEHDRSFDELSPARLSDWLKTCSDRMDRYRRDPRVRYVLLFKNSGPAAGATKTHPHAQLMALDFTPEQLKEESRRASVLRARGRHACADCRETAEEASSPRRIWRDARVVAFAPRVSAAPYEAVIRTRRHLDRLGLLTAAERRSVAEALSRIVTTLAALDIDYNLYHHDIVEDARQHFELRIVPRPNVWGGLEFASGVTVNTVPPESAAGEYRKKR